MDLKDFFVVEEEYIAQFENLVATDKRVIRRGEDDDDEGEFADLPYEHISSVVCGKSDPPRWIAIFGALLLVLGATIATEAEPGIALVFVGIILIIVGLLAKGNAEIRLYAPGLDEEAREKWVTEGELSEAREFVKTVRRYTFSENTEEG